MCWQEDQDVYLSEKCRKMSTILSFIEIYRKKSSSIPIELSHIYILLTMPTKRQTHIITLHYFTKKYTNLIHWLGHTFIFILLFSIKSIQVFLAYQIFEVLFFQSYVCTHVCVFLCECIGEQKGHIVWIYMYLHTYTYTYDKNAFYERFTCMNR